MVSKMRVGEAWACMRVCILGDGTDLLKRESGRSFREIQTRARASRAVLAPARLTRRYPTWLWWMECEVSGAFGSTLGALHEKSIITKLFCHCPELARPHRPWCGARLMWACRNEQVGACRVSLCTGDARDREARSYLSRANETLCSVWCGGGCNHRRQTDAS